MPRSSTCNIHHLLIIKHERSRRQHVVFVLDSHSISCVLNPFRTMSGVAISPCRCGNPVRSGQQSRGRGSLSLRDRLIITGSSGLEYAFTRMNCMLSRVKHTKYPHNSVRIEIWACYWLIAWTVGLVLSLGYKTPLSRSPEARTRRCFLNTRTRERFSNDL
jgi:hypothetical protein